MLSRRRFQPGASLLKPFKKEQTELFRDNRRKRTRLADVGGGECVQVPQKDQDLDRS